MLVQVSYKIPEEMKEDAYSILKSNGIKPSDAIRDFFSYIIKNKRMPMTKVLVSTEDGLE